MPFYKPYHAEFKQNDLIYGINKQREYYANNYKNFSLSLNPDINPIIDQYEITPFERFDRDPNNIPNNEQFFYNTLMQHPKYKAICKEAAFQIKAIDKGIVNQFCLESTNAIHRKCKGGLYWSAVSNQGKKAFHIHFILDKINLKQVILKNNQKDFGSQNFLDYLKDSLEEEQEIDKCYFDSSYLQAKIKNRSVTGSELRWIYRNRKDPYVQKAIQFWHEGKPCCPPWDNDFNYIYGEEIAHLWLLYRPKSHDSLQFQRIDSFLKRLCKLAAM